MTRTDARTCNTANTTTVIKWSGLPASQVRPTDDITVSRDLFEMVIISRHAADAGNLSSCDLLKDMVIASFFG